MAEKSPDVKYFCFDCKKNVYKGDYKEHKCHDIKEQSQALERIKEYFKICLNDFSTPDEYEQMITYLEDLKERKTCPQSLPSAPPIKIASWNLKKFYLKNDHLIKNKKVIIQCVCDTITKNHVSVIAFQEIGGEGDALIEVHTHLRKSTGGKWGMAVSKKSIGRTYPGMEYSAFMWNCSHGLMMTSEPYTVCLEKANGEPMFKRQPFVGEFTVFDEWNFSLVSFHLKCRNGGSKNIINDIEVKALHMVVDSVQTKLKNDVILLGDFNRSMEIHPDSELGKRNYTAIFRHTEYTNVLTDCYDNIIIPRSCRVRYHDDHGVDYEFGEELYKIKDGKQHNIFDHRLIFASLGVSY